jgi:hypothetical protein
MPQYLVAIHHPDNYDPSFEDEAMVRDIDALNEEMEAAAAFGYLTQRTWMRPWRGDAKLSSPAAHRSRCASSSQCQQNRNSNPRTRRLK